MLYLRSWLFSTVLFALLEGGEVIYQTLPLVAFLGYLSVCIGCITSYVYHVYESTPK